MLGRSTSSAVWDTLYSTHDRLFADKVMTEKDWQRLRKATHRHRLQPVTMLRVMLGYFPLLMWVAVLSVAVGLYDITLVQWYRWPMLSIQSVQTFFSAITFALTLLLVFKTNSSYARWWEARKDVGQLVSFAHNLMRQAVAYFPCHQAHLTHAMARWIAASMWVVKASVRQGANLREELRSVLAPEELVWLLAQPHKQLALGQALSSIVAAADIDPMAKSRLDGMLTLYTFEFGACGRIYNTAIPSAYTRHTSRFLLCYVFVGLPLLLWPLAGWSSPVLAVLISFLLLGVENIGAFMEEPFHVIAFDSFCLSVQRDVLNILAMHDNSQCACRSSVSNPLDRAGGNVPVVRNLSYHPPTSPAHAQQQQHHQAGDTLAQAQQQQQLSGPAQQQLPPWSSSSSSHGGAHASTNGAVAAAAAPASLQQPPQPLQPPQHLQLQQQGSTVASRQQQQLQQDNAALQPSSSRSCLLADFPHSHRE